MSTLGVTCGVTYLGVTDLRPNLPYPISVLGWRFGVNGAGAQNSHLGVSGAGLWVEYVSESG